MRHTTLAGVALLLLSIAVLLLSSACVAPAQPAAISPGAAGLTWRQCQLVSNDEEWRQVEACLGHPAAVWDDADQASAGEKTERGYRLQIGADTFETREFPTPIPNLSLYVLTRNGQLAKAYLGRFTTYSPDLGLYALAGNVIWAFDDGRVSTVFYGDEDLRAAYGADAVYAPYALGGRLIVVARRGSAYSVLYNGQQVGPTFDAITIAYCCEPVMYSARGGGGRYVFWGERAGARNVVEIGALGVSTASSSPQRATAARTSSA